MGQVAGVPLVWERHREGHHVLGRLVWILSKSQIVMFMSQARTHGPDIITQSATCLRGLDVLEVGHLGARPHPPGASLHGLEFRIKHGLHPDRVLGVRLAHVDEGEPVLGVGPHVLDPEVIPLAVPARVQVRAQPENRELDPFLIFDRGETLFHLSENRTGGYCSM